MHRGAEKGKEYFILTVQEILKENGGNMIDEKKVLEVLENWSDYWGKKTDTISLLKWATILRLKALIERQPKIGNSLENEEESK